VETPPGSYIVQPGDYVIALARRFGIPWTALAELNSISFPYVIHPGQVLQIPGNEKQEAEPQPVPDITEPVPVGKKDNFLARLPMVQRNYRAQTGQYFLAAPTSIESIQQASVSSSYSRGHFASWLSVDWQLLGKLKDLLLPYLIHAGELLKLQ
jgi:LysM repeat protein